MKTADMEVGMTVWWDDYLAVREALVFCPRYKDPRYSDPPLVTILAVPRSDDSWYFVDVLPQKIRSQAQHDAIQAERQAQRDEQAEHRRRQDIAEDKAYQAEKLFEASGFVVHGHSVGYDRATGQYLSLVSLDVTELHDVAVVGR